MIKFQQNWLNQGLVQVALRPINLLFLFGITRNCLRNGISLSFYLYFLFTTRAIKQNVVIIEAYHFCRLCTKCYPTSCCDGKPHTQRKFFGIISMDFDATVQLLIIFLYSSNIWEKWEYNDAMLQLFIDFKKAYDSVRREVLCNIAIEFGIPTKLIRLIKMCLNETYSRAWVGKKLSGIFPFRNGLKQGDALLSLLTSSYSKKFFSCEDTRRHRKTPMMLNQQFKEISKWNTPLISFIAQA